jgi:hypothetical protein
LYSSAFFCSSGSKSKSAGGTGPIAPDAGPSLEIVLAYSGSLPVESSPSLFVLIESSDDVTEAFAPNTSFRILTPSFVVSSAF